MKFASNWRVRNFRGLVTRYGHPCSLTISIQVRGHKGLFLDKFTTPNLGASEQGTLISPQSFSVLETS